MKFFIDTANIDEIKEANDMGMVDGVTTNPSLIAKEGRDFEEIIKEICEIVDGPISAEVVSTDTEGMLRGPQAIKNSQQYCCKNSHVGGWFKGDTKTFRRRDQDKCDTGLFTASGADGCKSRGDLC